MTVVMLTTNMARGGAETEVAHLALALRRRGHDVSVVSLLEPTAWASELGDAGVPLLASGIVRLPLVLRQLRPEVLHCHMFHANVAGRLLRMICPVPVVISTIHSLAETGRGSGDIRWRDCAYRLTGRLASATIAVSQAAADRHVSAKAVRHVRVIPNGIDTARFRRDDRARASLRAELGLHEEFVWLAVGRLMWKKDYPTLLAAFAQIRGATLLIAGAGPDEAALRRSAGPHVQFIGARDDVPALMNAADGFVLSSVVEGLPLVLLEAGASGLPVVATDAGGVREAGIAIALVPPRDPAALSAAMVRVMALAADERRRLGDMTRAHVAGRFDIDVVVQRWEALYRELWT